MLTNFIATRALIITRAYLQCSNAVRFDLVTFTTPAPYFLCDRAPKAEKLPSASYDMSMSMPEGSKAEKMPGMKTTKAPKSDKMEMTKAPKSDKLMTKSSKVKLFKTKAPKADKVEGTK